MNTWKWNWGRWSVMVMIGFAFIWAFDAFWHGHLLRGAYEATPELWRPMEDFPAYMKWMLLGQLWTAVMLGWIFLKGYEGKGIWEGARFGFLMGMLLAGPQVMTYAWLPIEQWLSWAWALGSWLQCIGVGILMAWLYKPAEK